MIWRRDDADRGKRPEIQDYLEELYYTDNRAYSYTESFLKMFYLIFGQAYSRNYIDVDSYNKLCVKKDTKIHKPKLKIEDELDIVSFDDMEIEHLGNYFCGTNAETAYMLGKYWGLRINECYGLKWSNVDLKSISFAKAAEPDIYTGFEWRYDFFSCIG